MRALLVLLLAAGFYHVRIGMQVVLEDYVHTPLGEDRIPPCSISSSAAAVSSSPPCPF